jgi:hypothetical protein
MREVSAHAQNDNRSIAAEIFAIGTYFPNSPRNRRMMDVAQQGGSYFVLIPKYH